MTKDFTGAIDTSRGGMMNDIATATATKGQQGTATPQEQAQRAAEMRTQGRKGCKLPRINVAFSPENHEFIRIMAGISGQTMTELINDIIADCRKRNLDKLESVKKYQINFEK